MFNKPTALRLSTFVLTGALLWPNLSVAQPADDQNKDWTFSVGAASLLTPAYQGSDNYAVMAVPDLRLKYKNRFFASIPEGVGYNILARDPGQSGWKVGPITKIQFSRDENGQGPFIITGETNDLDGMGEVDTAFEVGGFIDYQWQKLQTRLEVRQGFGGHEGVVADLELNYRGRLGDGFFAVGPRMTWASADYNQTYFGVDATQAAATGLAQYNAGSGIASYGVGGFALIPLRDKVTLTAFAGYDRLADEVADSSFIRERGTANQLTVGLGVSYAFNF